MAELDTINHAQHRMDLSSLWNLEDVNTFRLQKTHGKWQRSLGLILREDKLKCQVWNEEVQTLLIFAGLFSAVVTAFVIQSYQDIQQIPTNQAIALLLINNISSSPVLSQAAITISEKSSYSSSQRVNTVWFLSLTLSLITVLVGIITMQWIREYQRYSDSSPAKRKLAVRNMRTEGLEKWKVPEIIASLPLILQTAVVLFFIGLIDFLTNVNIVIAIPVIVAVTIALLFIFMTIILPTFQCLWVVNGRIPGDQISQCPYKSPQAWTFLQTSSHPFLRWYILPFFVFPLVIITPIILPFSLVIFKCVGIQLPTFDTSSQFMKKFIKNMGKKNLESWDRYDGLFLKRRTQVILASRNPQFEGDGDIPTTGTPFDYDASMGIANFLDEHVYDKTLACAAYDCFRELPTAIITDDFLIPKYDSRNLGTNGHSTRLSDVLPSTTCHTTKANLQRHEHEVLFLEHLLRPLESDCVPILRARQLEVFVRMLGHIFTDKQYMQRTNAGANTVAVDGILHRLRDTQLLELLVPNILNSCEGIHSLPEDTVRKITVQILEIFKTLIMQILRSEGRNVSVFCLCENLICDLVQLVHTLTVAASFRPSNCPSTLLQTRTDPFRSEQFVSIMSILTSINPSMPPEMDVLAFIGASFASYFRPEELNTWKTQLPEGVSHLTGLIYSLQAFDKQRSSLTKFLCRNKRINQWQLLSSMVRVLPQQIEKISDKLGPLCLTVEKLGGEANGVYFVDMSDGSACTSIS